MGDREEGRDGKEGKRKRRRKSGGLIREDLDTYLTQNIGFSGNKFNTVSSMIKPH